jgi:hypothetical protein
MCHSRLLVWILGEKKLSSSAILITPQHCTQEDGTASDDGSNAANGGCR